MLKILLTSLILILAFPVGYLLAWLCRDELVSGRRWFKLLAFLSLIFAAIFLFFNLTISLSLFFIFIVILISLKKGYDKKWVKKGI
jgi:uncharacterized membrane protein YoaK (UPF0700 family)